MARLRSSQRAPLPANIASDRGILKEKTINTKQRPALTNVATEVDGDELVKDAPARGLKRKARSLQNEGALKAGPGQEALLDSAAQPAQPARKIEPMKVPSTITKKPPGMTRKPVRSAARTQVLDGLMKRIEETARQEATKQTQPLEGPVKTTNPAPDATTASQLSDLTVTPSPPRIGYARNSMLSVHMPGSALRSHATPGADTSTFALKHFKQRKRQGSILQIVQQKIASARPSAVHVPSDDEDVSTTFALGAASDEEDDFRPDAEGTPMQKRLDPPASGTQLGKRKSDVNSSSSALDRLKSKRSKPSPVASHERRPDSSVHVQSRLSASTAALSEASHMLSPRIRIPQSIVSSQEHYASLNDDADDLDAIIPSTERQMEPGVMHHGSRGRATTPLDGTMADPASSSPLPSPTGHDQNLASLTAKPLIQPSRLPSSRRTKSRPKAKTASISTAHLQSLLPKRRGRNGRPRQMATKSVYEISSDDDTSDEEDHSGSEDELAPRRPPQKRANRKQPDQQARSRHSKPLKKTPAPSKRRTAAKSAKQDLITYGRQRASDKDNETYETTEEHEDTTLQEVSMYEASKSKELDEIKKKFADIDDLELEFESMSGDDNHRSSQSWR